MKIITGSSNPDFAASLRKKMDIEPINVDISTFSNGEKRVWITDTVQGENVVFVQSFSNPTDEHIMEFLLISDALERLGARHVNAIIPWMGYSFQDKVFRTGEPIAAKVVANLVSHSSVKRVFMLDLHNSSVPGFFSKPTVNLSALPLFADHVQSHFDTSDAVVASPDFGGLKRARQFADMLGTDLANIDKHRDLHTGEITAQNVQGASVAGKKVFLFDDAIMSGATVKESCRILHQQGAKEVHFLATHPIFTDGALEKITDDSVTSLIITNTIAHTHLPEKVTVLDSAPLFAEALNPWKSH